MSFWLTFTRPGNFSHSDGQKTTLNKMILRGTIWLFNIAMENGIFIDGLPIKNGYVPWLC